MNIVNFDLKSKFLAFLPFLLYGMFFVLIALSVCFVFSLITPMHSLGFPIIAIQNAVSLEMPFVFVFFSR